MHGHSFGWLYVLQQLKHHAPQVMHGKLLFAISSVKDYHHHSIIVPTCYEFCETFALWWDVHHYCWWQFLNCNVQLYLRSWSFLMKPVSCWRKFAMSIATWGIWCDYCLIKIRYICCDLFMPFRVGRKCAHQWSSDLSLYSARHGGGILLPILPGQLYASKRIF